MRWLQDAASSTNDAQNEIDLPELATFFTLYGL